MVKINEIQGDLFTCGNDNLAHCVSEDLSMSKGIATHFRKKFAKVDVLKRQNKKTGEVAYLEIDGASSQFIFYLITKEKYYERPTYEDLYQSLVELKDLCVAKNLKSLSMPKIGCGLDKLKWDMVKMYLETVFKNVDILINVYYL